MFNNLSKIIIILIIAFCSTNCSARQTNVSKPELLAYSCLHRTLPNHTTETTKIFDKSDFSLEHRIQIYKSQNIACAMGQPCFVEVEDRIGIWKFTPEIFVVSRRLRDTVQKEAVAMKLVRAAPNTPRYLKGVDADQTKYYLFYLGDDQCTYSSATCHHYGYEIFTPEHDLIYETPEEGTWIQNCSSPAQPGGGSGEDPPKNPG